MNSELILSTVVVVILMGAASTDKQRQSTGPGASSIIRMSKTLDAGNGDAKARVH